MEMDPFPSLLRFSVFNSSQALAESLAEGQFPLCARRCMGGHCCLLVSSPQGASEEQEAHGVCPAFASRLLVKRNTLLFLRKGA